MRTWTLVAAALGLALSGCGANVLTTSVKGQATLEGNGGVLGGVLSSFPGISGFTAIDFSQDQAFKNQGVKKENVTSVKVTAMRLDILSPTSGDFRFLDSLEFTAKEGASSAIIGGKTGIAQETPSRTLVLTVQDVELQPYVVAPSMTITTSGKGRPPSQDTTLEAVIDLRVEWKLF